MAIHDSATRPRKQLMSLAPWAASLVATVAAVACGGPSGTGQTSQGTGGSRSSTSSAGGGSSTATTAAGVTSASASSSGAGGGESNSTTGIPCDVLDTLQARCVSCHSNPPIFKAPMALVTYADLTAMSMVDAAQTVAERCVVRMQKAGTPMPPGAMVSVPAAEVAAFSAWIQAGYPKGECVPPDAGPADDAGMTP